MRLSEYTNHYARFLNEYQGDHKKVLCVCTAGILRSPTTALVLSQEPYNFNTRCAGVDPNCALVPVTKELVFWADEIVCMEDWHSKQVQHKLNDLGSSRDRKIITLDIEDKYAYRDPELMHLIRDKYDEKSIGN